MAATGSSGGASKRLRLAGGDPDLRERFSRLRLRRFEDFSFRSRDRSRGDLLRDLPMVKLLCPGAKLPQFARQQPGPVFALHYRRGHASGTSPQRLPRQLSQQNGPSLQTQPFV
mmetsp:Transcript_19298/g.58290  ORF Transcript_19298/g.58290 Transcript_19298/m.58290 type:complete len:114 (+) Transcript_19298:3920-4261(+)